MMIKIALTCFIICIFSFPFITPSRGSEVKTIADWFGVMWGIFLVIGSGCLAIATIIFLWTTI